MISPPTGSVSPEDTSPSASPRPQGPTDPNSHLSTPAFLATLSPRKSAALTETSKSLALAETPGSSSATPTISASVTSDDVPKYTLSGSQAGESAPQALSHVGQDPETRPGKLSLRLGSAINTTLASTTGRSEAEHEDSISSPDVKIVISDGGDDGDVVEEAAVVTVTPLQTSAQPDAESTIPQGEEDQVNVPAKEKDPELKASGWTTWTSRAASGSLSFFKQGTTTAAGWGTALTSNPFRGSTRSPPTPTETEAGPSRPRSMVGSDDDDDVAMARSAADALRIGAKNEERRRAAQARSRQQEGKSSRGSASESSKSIGKARSGQEEEIRLPARMKKEAYASSESRSTSPSVRGLNTFDYADSLPGACDPPTGDVLPERKYFVLTQAGKPVFLSHLAARRLEREDAARARLKALRESKRDREQQRKDISLQSEDSSGDIAALNRLDEEEDAKEEAARRKDQLASDEDEEESAVQVGVIQALISNYIEQGAAVLESKSIEILELPKTSSRVIFLTRGPLYLAVTSTWHDGGQVYADSATILKAHLEVLHAGLISLISESQLNRLFARGHNFDLRRMLEGTDGILSSLVARCQVDFGLILGAGGGGGICLRPTRLDLKLREDLGSCLSLERWENRPLTRALAGDSGNPSQANQSSNGESRVPRSPSLGTDLDPAKLKLEYKVPARPKDLLYILLLTSDGQLITMLRPRRLSAYPLDLHLLMNTIVGMSRRSQREPGTVNWIPICLPRFAPQGMVQAHISWLHGDSQRYQKAKGGGEVEPNPSKSSSESKPKAECALVIVTADRESFDEIGAWRDGVVKALSLPPSPLASLSHALHQAPISPDSLRLPGLRHFVLKKKDDLQVVWSEWIDIYAGVDAKASLARDRVRKAYARARELSVLGAKMGRSGKKAKKAKETARTSDIEHRKVDKTDAQQAVNVNPDPSGSVEGDVSQKKSQEVTIQGGVSTEVEAIRDKSALPSPSSPIGDSGVVLPTSLLPQENVTSHYFHTPYEAFYIEVPPVGTSNSLTGPLVADMDPTSPFEIYLTLSPNVPPMTARKIARQVVRWGLGSGGGGLGGEGVGGERWRLFVSGRGMVF